MTATTFFAIMAVVGVVLMRSSKKVRRHGKTALVSLGTTILVVSLFGLFTSFL